MPAGSKEESNSRSHVTVDLRAWQLQVFSEQRADKNGSDYQIKEELGFC